MQSTSAHWSAYEIFAVLSGIILLGAAFVPNAKVKDRAWAVLGGIGFIWYGWYVAHQTTGTFSFPVIIFLIPPGAVIYLLVKAFGDSSERNAPAGGADEGNRRSPGIDG